MTEQERLAAEQKAAAEQQEKERLRRDEEKVQAETALHEKHSAETAALVKNAQEKAAGMDDHTKPEQQQQQFEAEANRLNSAFQRQDGERGNLYANNTASTSLGQQLQNDNRETLAEERNAQRVKGAHEVCEAFAKKQFEIANQPDVDRYANLMAERGESAAAVNDAADDYKNRLAEQQNDDAGRVADLMHEQSFDAVRRGLTPGEPANAPAEEPDYPKLRKGLEALREASDPDAKGPEEDIWENKDNPLYGQRGSEKAYAFDKLKENHEELQDQWNEKHDNPEVSESPSQPHSHSADLPSTIDPSNNQGDACYTTSSVGVPDHVEAPHGLENMTDPITPLVIQGLATYVILKDRFDNKGVPSGDTRPPDDPPTAAPAEAPKPTEPQPSYAVSQTYVSDPAEFDRARETAYQPPPGGNQPNLNSAEIRPAYNVNQTYVTDPAEFQRTWETAHQAPSGGPGGNQPSASTVEVPNVPPPTFGKPEALGAQDAELVKMYAERQKDLGKADQGVQEFASQLKTMEAQAQAPAAPAPEVKTAGPDDLPIAWGGGNMGVVGRVERSTPTEPGARALPDPPEPAAAPAPAPPAPGPELQNTPAAPAPAAPAPQQPAPSLSPSL